MSRRLPPNSCVVRRLFPSSSDDEAMNDNFSNRQKELAEKELEEQSIRWHYNFKDDCPLPGEGNYKWFDIENGQLLGANTNNNVGDDEEDETLPSAAVNEVIEILDNKNDSDDIDAEIAEEAPIKMDSQSTPEKDEARISTDGPSRPVKNLGPADSSNTSADGEPSNKRAKKNLENIL